MNPAITPWDTLAGQYRLQPGLAHSIVGQRPVLVGGRLGRLLQGQFGEQVGRSLSSVFTLCAHAHRRAADMALAAAQAAPQTSKPGQEPVLLWLETARDHLRSMALDWPQRLPEPDLDARRMDWLQGCPLPLGTVRPLTDATVACQMLAALRLWLAQRVLGQAPQTWLAAHREPDALAAWCQAQAEQLAPARCLLAWRPVAQRLAPDMRCLDVLDADPARQTAGLHQLASSLVADPEFVQRPTWLGQCAENGPWSRLRHRQAQAVVAHSAWTRLSARWLELVEIAAADPYHPEQGRMPLLASGALQLAAGQALAWVEMARGLLFHWVQLDAAGAVQDYRVLAPTEWNFHPQGALAQALSALPVGETVAASTLAAAFDPCVACTV
jgi:hypothetical protein